MTSRTPSRPRIPPPRRDWLKRGESICVIIGVFLLVFQSFLQWQELEAFKEQLQLQRTDVMALREALARDAYSRSTDTALRLGDTLLEHPDIRSAMNPADPLNCLPTTVQEGYQYLVLNLDLIASLWGYHQRGAIDDEEWTAWERWLEGAVVRSWLFPALWDRERDYYNRKYRDYVDGLLAAVTATREASAAPTPPPDLIALATESTLQDPTGTPSAACVAHATSEADVRLSD